VFVVGEQRAEEVTLVPTLSWIEHDFIELSEEDMTSCDYSNRTELHFDLSSGEEMIDHSIHLYRVPANLVHSGSVITDEDLEDRFHTVLRHEEYASLSTKISDTSVAEEYCFVARYSNAAGQEGPISAAVCSMNYDPMQWECGTGMGPIGWFGCSNIGTSTASLFTMIMSVFGLVRRRKK